MRRRIRFGRWSLPLLLAGFLAVGSSAAGAQEPDAARSGDAAVFLERILLLLQPSPAQQKALDTLLAAQQTPCSRSFHKWLTPAQYADRFAVSKSGAATIVDWLRAQGFAVAPLPASRGWIEFSGSRSQVEHAFDTHLSALETSAGEIRYQLAGPARFPEAITANVKGLVSLDGALSASAATAPVEIAGSAEALAAETSLSHAQSLTPSLAQSWLHLVSRKADGVTGAGEAIAIPSRSNVRQEDFAAFRKSFGLPESALLVQPASENVGRTSEEAATMLAASWAGVAAPEAKIVLVPAASTNATDGIDLALAATIDGALAHTVSLGYSACEASLSATHQAFYAALYRQAAAEGIAVVAATGDSGAAACHSPLDASSITTGWGVNALASTPWNIAVGAAAFTADNSTLSAWQSASSAKSTPAYATGGGASLLYATPEWQSAAGLPATNPTSGSPLTHPRYLPDVSLPGASNAGSSRGLAFCFSGDSGQSGCRLATGGGSAASAAVLSGIAALLAQKYGAQGNLAPNLYALSHHDEDTGKSTPIFNDIATGSAKLPCALGSPGCSEKADGTGEIGFDAAPGYDLATGLGSVNAQGLVASWATPQATGTATPTVTMTTIGGVTYNPSADIPLSAKVISGSGGVTPTGTVQFFDQTNSQDTGTPVTLASDGTATYTENAQFSIGGHNIAAIYSGDSVYTSATSQPITINIQPSATSLTVSLSTVTPSAGSSIIVTGTVTAINPGASPPTGSLTVNLDGLAQGTQRFTTTAGLTTASVTVTAPTGGSHTIQGTYSGDINYNNSTSPSVTIAVSKGATATTIAATPSTLTAGVPETFTATVAPATTTTTAFTITGTISFYDGGTTLLGTAAIASNTAILTGIVLSTTAAHTVTAVYSGDTSWITSVSSPLLLEPILLPVTVTLTASSAVILPGQSATLTATVTPVNPPVSTAEQHPTGTVLFYAGTTPLGSASVAAGVGDSAVATLVVPHLRAGAYVITAQYAGDATYGPALSNSLNLGIEDFTVTCTAPDGSTNLKIKQGTSKTATCVVASLGGLTGPIQIVCAEQNPPQVGAIGCTFFPTILDGGGLTTLTVVTTAGNISTISPGSGSELRPGHPPDSRHGPSAWPAAGGGVVLAFAGLLLSPIGRRARWLRQSNGRLLALGLLLAGMAGAGLGCSNSVVSTNNGGTPLGVHTLKITAAADVNTVTVSHYAYFTVNVTP